MTGREGLYSSVVSLSLSLSLSFSADSAVDEFSASARGLSFTGVAEELVGEMESDWPWLGGDDAWGMLGREYGTLAFIR